MNKRKEVRFSSDENQEIASTYSDDLVDELWMSPSDFEAIRTESHIIATQSSRSRFALVLDEVHLSVEDTPLEAQENLNLWSKFAHSRRGLEAQISIRIRYNRIKVRRRVWQAVLGAQEHLRLAKCPDDKKTELIATLSLLESLQARKIAEMIGTSDFVAAMDSRSHRTQSPQGFSKPDRLSQRTTACGTQVMHRSPVSTMDF